MHATVFSGAILGVDGLIVEVEVDISRGIPCFTIVGMPSTAVRESRERVTAALKNGGRLAALNPTYNQIENMSGALQKAGFMMIEAMEVLVRGILARPGKTRPEQRMVSHTEFMIFALKPSARISSSSQEGSENLSARLL